MNTRITFLFTVLTLVLATHGCRCRVPILKPSYYNPSAKRFVKAIPVQTFVHDNKRFYLLDIQREYKACPKLLRYVLASTSLSSASCGSVLQLKTPYVMPLDTTEFFVNINSCQFIRPYSRLTRAEVSFLESRQICCKRGCKCVNGKPLVNCFRRPCSPPEKPPCKEAVKCVDNYCGGCFAEWFNKQGTPACNFKSDVLSLKGKSG